MKKQLLIIAFFLFCSSSLSAQILLKPDRVFDGESTYEGWVVLVEDNRITQVEPATKVKLPEETETIELAGKTLMHGLIEGHSHILLHP